MKRNFALGRSAKLTISTPFVVAIFNFIQYAHNAATDVILHNECQGFEIACSVTYSNVKQLKPHFHVCRLCLIFKPGYLSAIIWLLYKLMNLFRKVIMRNDVTGCVVSHQIKSNFSKTKTSVTRCRIHIGVTSSYDDLQSRLLFKLFILAVFN